MAKRQKGGKAHQPENGDAVENLPSDPIVVVARLIGAVLERGRGRERERGRREERGGREERGRGGRERERRERQFKKNSTRKKKKKSGNRMRGSSKFRVQP
jgi:hypothetical protein